MKNIFYILFSVLIIQSAFAHGENKLGPHAGYIRMPGAFHVEVVSGHEDTYSVYLMDVGNKYPVTNNSSVNLSHVSNAGKKTDFKCFPIDDHFSCKLGVKINSQEGKLLVKAVRNKAQGSVAEYPLPLRLEGEAPRSEHENHKMSH